jgi:DNA-binding SARP family transcriptional activator
MDSPAAPPAGPVQFCLLGPMQVHYRGAPLQVRGNKQRLLLATLLLQGNRVVTTDVLAEALWGAAPPPTARVTIHNYVKRPRDARQQNDRLGRPSSCGAATR